LSSEISSFATYNHKRLYNSVFNDLLTTVAVYAQLSKPWAEEVLNGTSTQYG